MYDPAAHSTHEEAPAQQKAEVNRAGRTGTRHGLDSVESGLQWHGADFPALIQRAECLLAL
jgi:hypothetical protein